MHVKLRNRRAYVMRSIPNFMTLPMGKECWVPKDVSARLRTNKPSLARIVAVGREGTVLTLDVR